VRCMPAYPSFVLGQVYPHGVWVLLSGDVAISLLWRPRPPGYLVFANREQEAHRRERDPFPDGTPVFYLIVAMSSKINIGCVTFCRSTFSSQC